MDNEEKKVKNTKTVKTTAKKAAPKKEAKTTTVKRATVAKKKEEVKASTKTKAATASSNPKTEKKTATSKTASKTTTTKRVVKKLPDKKEVVVPVKEEVKVVKPKEKKVVTNEEKVVEPKVSKKELKEIRKKRYIFEAIVILALVAIALVLVFNRTFLSVNYKTDSVDLEIPRFSYFISDEDNVVKLVTLRKSENLNEYYNEYLEGFTFYSCAEGDTTFYYDEKTDTLIKEIKVEKNFALKTVSIMYDTRTPEEVCGLR
ncbi:MAG: hypothetical protein IJO43_02515 [Bacilli bacterium]|nr:hypothetical protein [Bacilli bacterium]